MAAPGDGSDSTDPENYSGDDSSTGSSSASNARTADNSPIATMMMLASLSLVAGGYVLVRKRKERTQYDKAGHFDLPFI